MESYFKLKSYQHPPGASFNPKSDVSESDRECPLSKKQSLKLEKKKKVIGSSAPIILIVCFFSFISEALNVCQYIRHFSVTEKVKVDGGPVLSFPSFNRELRRVPEIIRVSVKL